MSALPRQLITWTPKLALATILIMAGIAPRNAQSDKPNIVVIWGDDIGIDNVSAQNLGMIGIGRHRVSHGRQPDIGAEQVFQSSQYEVG